MEVADEAIVDPQPVAVTEGVAVGLLHRGARRGADVGQEQRRVDVASDLAEVAVVPGGLDAVENGGSFDVRGVPADAEAVAVRGIDAHAGVAALVYQGVRGLVEQPLDEDGRSRVGEPAAHHLLLSWVELRRANIPGGELVFQIPSSCFFLASKSSLLMMP